MIEKDREKVMRKLGRRSYSSYELRLKLKAEVPDIEEILVDFIEKGYINDHDWLLSFIRSEESKGRGPMAISQKLRQKGYPREEIESAMPRNGSSREALDLAFAKKTRKFSDRNKIINSLLRLGFAWDDIKNKFQEVQVNLTDDSID